MLAMNANINFMVAETLHHNLRGEKWIFKGRNQKQPLNLVEIEQN